MFGRRREDNIIRFIDFGNVVIRVDQILSVRLLKDRVVLTNKEGLNINCECGSELIAKDRFESIRSTLVGNEAR